MAQAAPHEKGRGSSSVFWPPAERFSLTYTDFIVLAVVAIPLQFAGG